jgi:hypothetical protein
VRDPWSDSELAQHFAAHARASVSRAPLNAALAGIIARRRNLHGLLAHAPATQRLPVLLLAAIHFLVLDEPEQPLARWYPNITEHPHAPGDRRLAATLEAFVEERAAAILELVASRHVQTNEVGRCAVLLPALRLVADDVGPLAHLDVGTSAGLNLLLPKFSYRYDDGPAIEHAGSTVEIDCSTRSQAPLDLSTMVIPEIASSCGVDVRPVDVTDPTAARWLEACCWPDQTDRFDRLSAAIGVARAAPPELLAGDAVDSLAGATARMSTRGHVVVTTTWTLNYLTPTRRHDFVVELDRIGADLDLSWVSAESPALTPELPHADDLRDEHLTELTVVSWRNGRRSVRHLAETHPHGYWIHWR